MSSPPLSGEGSDPGDDLRVEEDRGEIGGKNAKAGETRPEARTKANITFIVRYLQLVRAACCVLHAKESKRAEEESREEMERLGLERLGKMGESIKQSDFGNAWVQHSVNCITQ